MGRVRLGRALRSVCAIGVIVALGSGCTVNEPRGAKAACLAGEPCGDAAADTQSEVLVGPDAHAEPAPSVTEAGTSTLCPTACNPEDVQSCQPTRLQQQVRLESGPSDAGQAGSIVALEQILGSDASLVVFDAAISGEIPNAPPTTGLLDGGGQVDFEDATSETLMSVPLDAALDAGTDAAVGGRDGGRGQLDVLDAAAGGDHGTQTPVLACQLVNDEGVLGAECGQAGSGSEGSACASARDCKPGLGCVGSAGAGQCLPYCCGGNDSCGEGTYCTQKPLRSLDVTDEATAPTIPVCAVADNCSLMLGPCTDPGACSCPSGLACTIVRASTTACVEPGSGSEGESCPCAPGYFCSQGTNTCLKFCNTKDPASNCGARECQPGPSGFPMGWGLCVGN